MINTSMLKAILVSTLFLTLSACASHYGSAHITSSPPGAQVINVKTGETLGVTPLLINWTESRGTRQQIAVTLNKAGYYQKTEGFWLDMNYRSAKKANNKPNLVEISMRKIGE